MPSSLNLWKSYTYHWTDIMLNELFSDTSEQTEVKVEVK